MIYVWVFLIMFSVSLIIFWIANQAVYLNYVKEAKERIENLRHKGSKYGFCSFATFLRHRAMCVQDEDALLIEVEGTTSFFREKSYANEAGEYRVDSTGIIQINGNYMIMENAWEYAKFKRWISKRDKEEKLKIVRKDMISWDLPAEETAKAIKKVLKG